MPARRTRPEVRIRMYRVGFGDCFLLTFPGPKHVLVDCGVHNQGDIGTFDRVRDDIVAETKRKLAVIAVSHAHEDHIAGFARYGDVFGTFDIDSVWLPWTENPKDELARKLGRSQAALYEALAQHFAARPPSAAVQAVMANAAVSRNKTALDNLRAAFGTGAEVTWHQGGDAVEDAGGIPGLSVRFLGPPRDEAFLKKMDPPKPERYLRASAGGPQWQNVLWPVPPEYFRLPGEAGPTLIARQATALRRAAAFSPEALAFALDDALNNTSLVCLFSYRGTSMLFPGDAQFGNWKSWIMADDAPEILDSVRFYKVAHHGSENATPKSALEGMRTGEVVAMMSTQSEPWPSIPYPKLLTALERQTGNRVIQSDSLPVEGAPEGPALADLPTGFRQGPLWFDYHLPL